MTNISIREFLSAFDAGEFDDPSSPNQMKVWYDWFCRDTSLYAKTKFLAKRLKTIADSPKINQDTMCVAFKNNCPVNGRLYDSIVITDIESGDVQFWITPSIGHYQPEEQYNKPVVANSDLGWEGKPFKNWNELKKWFNE